MKQETKDKKTLWIWVLIMALFMVELYFFVRFRVQCTQMGYEIIQVRSQNQKHIKTAYSLRVELASLRSHERIINKAQREFGLVIPSAEQIVVLP